MTWLARHRLPLALLIAVLGWLAAPVAGGAQPAGRTSRVGHLGLTNPVAARPGVEAWTRALRERGWVEGQNLVVEFRWAGGTRARLPALAAELAGLKVDVIVASGDSGILAAKDATTTIPIVMAGVTDPVGRGLVQSLARPGGNLTGITWDVTPEVIGKELELLTATVPAATRVAFLWDPEAPHAALYWQALHGAASRLGVELQRVEARRAEDLDAAFAAVIRERADALLVLTSAVTYVERARVARLALEHRLPTMFDIRLNVEAGGLMAYGISLTRLAQRSAYYVDRILRGARPADLPIERPTTYELVINLRTAKTLGLTIPPAVLARADEVLE